MMNGLDESTHFSLYILVEAKKKLADTVAQFVGVSLAVACLRTLISH